MRKIQRLPVGKIERSRVSYREIVTDLILRERGAISIGDLSARRRNIKDVGSCLLLRLVRRNDCLFEWRGRALRGGLQCLPECRARQEYSNKSSIREPFDFKVRQPFAQSGEESVALQEAMNFFRQLRSDAFRRRDLFHGGFPQAVDGSEFTQEQTFSGSDSRPDNRPEYFRRSASSSETGDRYWRSGALRRGSVAANAVRPNPAEVATAGRGPADKFLQILSPTR